MTIFLYDETREWHSFLKENVGEVECETDADVALSKLLLEEYDMAFINLYGSEDGSLAGLELLKKLRKADYFTPVVVFTTDESNRYIKEAYDAGCDWYFIKGMDSASEFAYLLDRYTSPDVLLPRRRLRSIYKALVSDEPVPVLRFEDNPVVSYRKKGDVLSLTEMSDYGRKLLGYGLNSLAKRNLADREVREKSMNMILPFFIKGGGDTLPSVQSFVENGDRSLGNDFYENGLKLEIIELFYQTDLEKHIDYSGINRMIKKTTHSINKYMPVDVVIDDTKETILREGVEYLPVIVENSYDISGYVPSSQFAHLPEIPRKFKAIKKKYFFGETHPESLQLFDYFEVEK